MADQPEPFDRLTPREIAVAVRIAEGDRNAQIAKMLGCSSKTVDTHRANALKKLNLRHNVDLTREAIRVGLVVLPGVLVGVAAVRVFTDAIAVAGVPPRTVEALVQGGDETRRGSEPDMHGSIARDRR